MCGLVGWLDYHNSINRNSIIQMNNQISHRGPDSNGIWTDKIIGLGHSRLAVIDTSKKANQPMVSGDGRYIIVYNGEIYNFKEIMNQLQKEGEKFKTSCDTEVILLAYKIWGKKSVIKFNGMFAFAIWDTKNKTLFMARDRVGEKPLYYKTFGDAIIFASEIEPIINKLNQSNVCNKKVLDFLENNYVSNSQTIIENIEQLPPGHTLFKEKGKPIEISPYWSLVSYFEKKNEINETEAKEQLLNLLDRSIKLRMISDVPLGVFLSGGIDSASVVSSMLNFSKEIKVITMGFKEKSYDESEDAKKTANFLNTPSENITIETNQLEIIKAINCASKNLLADNSAIPFWFMSQKASQHVKVALTGDGADETFAGYETYIADKIAYKYLNFLSPKFWKYVKKICNIILPVTFKKISLDFKIKQFSNGMINGWPNCHFAWRQIFSQSEIKRLINPEIIRKTKFENSLKKKFFKNNLDFLDESLLADINTWLTDCLLIKSDRMSMAHGLEVRSPFLDHNLLEFSASLPSNLKMKGFQKKYILKKSQEKRLSKEILQRKKRGFNSPINHWLNSTLKEFAGDILFSKKLNNFLNIDFINKLWNDHQQKKRDNSFKIYNLLILSIWLQNNYKNINLKT